MHPGYLDQARPAAHAGRFYPADPAALSSMIRSLVDQQTRQRSGTSGPVALLAPHAGYVYSGNVAASTFSLIRGLDYDGVMILGPSHTHQFRGIALAPHASFLTPLGGIEGDRHDIDVLLDNDLFFLDDKYHAREHAAEVELPFLQEWLAGPFRLIAGSIGQCSDNELTSAADSIVDMITRSRRHDRKWLLIASSDTYHGYDPDLCRENDRKISGLVKGLDHENLLYQSRNREIMACGWMPLVVTMDVAKQLGVVRGLVLKRDDSRENTWQPGNYVVGYLGAAFGIETHEGR